MAIKSAHYDATELHAILRTLKANMTPAVKAALVEEMESIKKVSMARTPVLTGALRDSHEIVETENSVEIHVGGDAAPYALYVHENLQAHHPHGQAKFLESAMLEAIPGLADRIAEKADPLD